MYQFIESIKIKNGQAFLLNLHQQRVYQTFANFHHKCIINLHALFSSLQPPQKGLYKWRFIYNLNGDFEHQFIPYSFTEIKDFELVENNEIDYPKMERLLEAAQGLDVVFHMAFDAIPAEYQFGELDWLVEHGVKRILTHGGPASESILEHLAWMDELIEHAAGRIEILPGGGINLDNRAEIADTLGVDQLHGTKVVF